MPIPAYLTRGTDYCYTLSNALKPTFTKATLTMPHALLALRLK